VKSIVLEVKRYPQKWLQTGYTNKHCSVNLNGGEIMGAGGNDGRINCTLRVKEQALR
jgi:hypothetical protein